MKKGLIIAVTAAFVVIGGLSVYLTTKDASDTNSSTQQATAIDQNQNQQKHTQPQVEKASITEYLKTGDDKKCTYTSGENSDTMYFAKLERLRMDFQRTGDKPSKGSMIIQNKKQYVWQNNSKEGFTFAFSPEKNPSTQQTESNQSVDVYMRNLDR